MGFVRTKKIKNNEYCYLVENSWTAKGSRQKVAAYLGKCIRSEKEFQEEIPELSNLNYKESILALLKWQLTEHGFNEGVNNLLLKEQVLADLEKVRFRYREQPCVLALNEGFVCEETVKQALEFIPSGQTEEQIGAELAGVLLEAGLSLPSEVFVQVFEKIHNVFKNTPNSSEK
jgi:hypothetical protein